jgi:hypothetical protein
MKLKKTNKSINVPAPEGYHWMTEGGRHFLMKGAYKPHKGASKEAPFRLVTHNAGEPNAAMDAARRAKKG